MAATRKLTGCPAVTAWSAGWAAIMGPAGGAFTVKVAAALAALPEPLRTTARKVAPLSARVVAGVVNQFAVAPGISTPFFRH